MWIELASYTVTSPKRCLIDHGTIQRLATKLSNPHSQYPQIVLCVGAAQKSKAVSDLFPFVAPRCDRLQRATMDLYVSEGSLQDKYPLLVADVDLAAIEATHDYEIRCHEAKVWHIEDWDAAAKMIQIPVVLPFADVFCVFADDFGTNATDGLVNAVGDLTRLPLYAEELTGLPSRVIPHVFFITSAFKLPEIQCRKLRQNSSFIESSNMNALRSEISAKLILKRCSRTEDQFLFSALDLPWFISRAVHHTSQTRTRSFDVIKAFKEVPPKLTESLCSFVNLAEQHKIHPQVTQCVIAAALLSHAYYPPSHGESSRAQRVTGLTIW